MSFKVLMVIAAVSYSCTALPPMAPQEPFQNLDLAQTPGALSDIFSAVIDLLKNMREFQNRKYNRDPSRFAAIFPDFVRRIVEANARLRGRPVTDAERGTIGRIGGLEKVIADSTAQVTRDVMEALASPSDSALV